MDTAARCARSTPGALDAERAYLAEQNRIVEGELPTDFFDAPREAVVLSVDKQTARVAFGGEFEAELGLEANAWAHPAEDESKHGEKIDRLDKVFSVGDVARFRVAAPADDANPTQLSATLYQLPDAQGALVSIDLATRDVVAMVGGYDFAESEFNRTIQAQRQPGSAFKPIVYAAAVSHGYTPGEHPARPAGGLPGRSVGLRVQARELRAPLPRRPDHDRGPWPARSTTRRSTCYATWGSIG